MPLLNWFLLCCLFCTGLCGVFGIPNQHVYRFTNTDGAAEVHSWGFVALWGADTQKSLAEGSRNEQFYHKGQQFWASDKREEGAFSLYYPEFPSLKKNAQPSYIRMNDEDKELGFTFMGDSVSFGDTVVSIATDKPRHPSGLFKLKLGSTEMTNSKEKTVSVSRTSSRTGAKNGSKKVLSIMKFGKKSFCPLVMFNGDLFCRTSADYLKHCAFGLQNKLMKTIVCVGLSETENQERFVMKLVEGGIKVSYGKKTWIVEDSLSYAKDDILLVRDDIPESLFMEDDAESSSHSFLGSSAGESEESSASSGTTSAVVVVKKAGVNPWGIRYLLPARERLMSSQSDAEEGEPHYEPSRRSKNRRSSVRRSSTSSGSSKKASNDSGRRSGRGSRSESLCGRRNSSRLSENSLCESEDSSYLGTDYGSSEDISYFSNLG